MGGERSTDGSGRELRRWPLQQGSAVIDKLECFWFASALESAAFARCILRMPGNASVMYLFRAELHKRYRHTSPQGPGGAGFLN